MKLLVVGRGQVGTYLAQRFECEEALWDRRDMDAITRTQLEMFAPELCVITAGKTDIDWCEKNPTACFENNVQAPLRLLSKLAQCNVPAVVLSTGCIWDGPYTAPDNGVAFGPHSTPSPCCAYAWSKVMLESLSAKYFRRVSILRPRLIYSPLVATKNTLTKMLTYPRMHCTPNSMTSVETIARTIEALWAQRNFNATLNVYDLGVTTPHRVGQILAEYKLRAEPEKCALGEINRKIFPRRVNVVMHDEYFEQIVSPPRVEDELRRVIGLFTQALSK